MQAPTNRAEASKDKKRAHASDGIVKDDKGRCR